MRVMREPSVLRNDDDVDENALKTGAALGEKHPAEALKRRWLQFPALFCCAPPGMEYFSAFLHHDGAPLRYNISVY